MKFYILLLLCVFAQAFAFAPRGHRARTSFVSMKVSDSPLSEGKKQFAKVFVTALSSLAIMSSPATAANYGGFGSTYSEVIDPKLAVLSEESNSDDVKAGISGLADIQKIVENLKTDIQKDNQIDLFDRLKKELNPATVRGILNKYNTAFSEDTQRGTDRLIRAVLQDITELSREVQTKPGKARADSKVKLIVRRLEATQASLKDLAAFYPR